MRDTSEGPELRKTTDDDETRTRRRAMETRWRDGLEQLEEGNYWEAHEEWESIWLELPPSAAREAVQALIQFAAACYKVEQTRRGRDADDMQRGLAGLVERARGHLDGAEGAGPPAPAWDVTGLRSSLAAIEAALEQWRNGAPLEAVAAEISEISTDLALSLETGAPSDQVK